VLDPRELLRRSIADLAVTSDHDQPLGADNGEPVVVERTTGDLGEIRMARRDDVAVLLGELLAERQVVLSTKNLTGKGRYAARERNCSS
jgi:hypothetical protein